MPSAELPARASLEYLKKLAKERVARLRRTDPSATLADAQLAVAREHGFPSWRALKAELDRRRAPVQAAYRAACARGDLAALRELLDRDPSLVRDRTDTGATGLHLAVRHPEALRLLLERGADPNVRERDDNALPLHGAAGAGLPASARVLIEGGSEVQGEGDAHRMATIGWATCFDRAHREIVDLLVAHGARHHVFSAIALNDPSLVRRVVEEDPGALRRRLSRHEQDQTALHYVIAPADGLVGGRFRTGPHYRTLELLIELGAEVEARDAKGRTPLAVALLRSDEEAARILHAAGARPPDPGRAGASDPGAAGEPISTQLAGSMGPASPMFAVRDLEATIAWYRALGFEIGTSHGDAGSYDWVSLRFGGVEIMLVPAGDRKPVYDGASVWIRTSRLDDLYGRLRHRRLERGRAALASGAPEGPDVGFKTDLYTAFYGQREFSVVDPNGIELCFYQPLE